MSACLGVLHLASAYAKDIAPTVVFPDPKEIEAPAAEVSGELKQWHKVTLTIDGPRASQYGQTTFEYNSDRDVLELDVRPQAGPNGRLTYMHPNPFLDFRMTVTFAHQSGSPRYEVPGYFAADGDAANTAAMSGDKWRAHLSPDKPGRWDWAVSFRAGVDVAIGGTEGLAYLPYDGLSGSFEVAETDKAGPGFRARGRLQYVGERYLRFAGSGEYFLKAGSDAPETLLAYADFENTKTMMVPGERSWIGPNDGHGLHEYAPHLQDWREGDPTWRGGKGKGLIGAANYLAGKGMNAMSFLTHTAGGDGDNVWPWVSRNEVEHYDVAKLAQWEVFFEHAQRQGLFLHFKLQEQENDAGYPNRRESRWSTSNASALDGGTLGRHRKLYTREMVARFGHHLALNWNLGEETRMLSEHQIDWAEHIKQVDPYGHHRVLHTAPNPISQGDIYEPLLGGASELTGVSLQTHYTNVHSHTLRWLRASKAAGKQWAVANDEQGPAVWAVPPDPGFQNWESVHESPLDLHDIRKYALWGNLMAGGWGVEYYFGYRPVHNDLVAEDFRSRDLSWNYARHALEFFRANEIPYWEMESANALIGNAEDDNSRYCFAKQGEVYVVYLPEGGEATLDLSGKRGMYSVSWYDPRSGGELQAGSVETVRGGAPVSLGQAPNDAWEDWAVFVRQR